MKKRVLIFGSGSVGTHHANAALSLNCEVFITDKKNSQLTNMKENTYPSRYGYWDNKINCINYKDVFKLKYNFLGVLEGSGQVIFQCFTKYIKLLSFTFDF